MVLSGYMSKQERMQPDQLSVAVGNLQTLEGQQAASFSRQVAEAPVGRREYRDVDYWREGFAKLLARSAAVVSVEKPLEAK